MRLRPSVGILLTALVVVWALPSAFVGAAEPVMELKWDQLVPPAPPKLPKSFLANRPGDPTKPGPQDATPAP